MARGSAAGAAARCWQLLAVVLVLLVVRRTPSLVPCRPAHGEELGCVTAAVAAMPCHAMPWGTCKSQHASAS